MFRIFMLSLALASVAVSQDISCPDEVVQTLPGTHTTGPWRGCVTPTIIVDGIDIAKGHKGCPEWVVIVPPVDIPVYVPDSGTLVYRAGRRDILKIPFKCKWATRLFIRYPVSCDAGLGQVLGSLDRLAVRRCTEGGR